MYELYLGRMLLPVTPEEIRISIKNKNQTITLIDGGEVNIPRDAGLTEISFSALLPQVKYPFACYAGGEFQSADAFVEYLEQLKTSKAPFQLILNRAMPTGKRLFDTNMSVTLEEYSITDAADQGFDLTADIRLKQWRPYGTKTIEIGAEIPTAPVVIEEERPIVENPKPSSGSGGSKKSSGKGIIAPSTGTKEAAEVAAKVNEAEKKYNTSAVGIPGVTELVGRMPTSTTGTAAKPGAWSDALKNPTGTGSAGSASKSAAAFFLEAGKNVVDLILKR